MKPSKYRVISNAYSESYHHMTLEIDTGPGDISKITRIKVTSLHTDMNESMHCTFHHIQYY